MNKKGASKEDMAVVEAVTEADDANTATGEAVAIKEEDTESPTKPRIIILVHVAI